MKKCLFALMLICALITSTFANAESAIPEVSDNFSLSNGISFGDTMKDVVEKETLELRENNSENGVIETAYSNLLNMPDDNMKESYIRYYFGYSKNKLEKITYYFGQTDSMWIALPQYDIINSMLIEKYGEPLGYENGEHYKVWDGAFKSSSFAVDMLNLQGTYAELMDYDEWVLKYDDYSVKVEHAYYAYKNEARVIVYSHSLSFAHFEE